MENRGRGGTRERRLEEFESACRDFRSIRDLHVKGLRLFWNTKEGKSLFFFLVVLSIIFVFSDDFLKCVMRWPGWPTNWPRSDELIALTAFVFVLLIGLQVHSGVAVRVSEIAGLGMKDSRGDPCGIQVASHARNILFLRRIEREKWSVAKLEAFENYVEAKIDETRRMWSFPRIASLGVLGTVAITLVVKWIGSISNEDLFRLLKLLFLLAFLSVPLELSARILMDSFSGRSRLDDLLAAVRAAKACLPLEEAERFS